MTQPRIFGDVPGVVLGSLFESRKALSVAGVHRPTMAGISGSSREGADSIVLNGGYEDDEDFGDVVVYTGHGGNNPDSRRQVGDQHLNGGNAALARSCVDGLPVRVIRGFREPSGLGPPAGFRYDGLYRVERYWQGMGRSGFQVWRFRLVRDDARPAPWLSRRLGEGRTEYDAAPRRESTIQRIVRNSAEAQRVKDLHQHQCQVCGMTMWTPTGPYAEGAHIRPLGRPHDGPDSMDNILCLCPNHHVQFDLGAIVIADDLTVINCLGREPVGQLRTIKDHSIESGHLAYHRRMFGFD